jgi:uncharacterized membrane protein
MELQDLIKIATLVFIVIISVYLFISFVVFKSKKGKPISYLQKKHTGGGVVRQRAVRGEIKITPKATGVKEQKFEGTDRMKVVNK